MYLHLKENAQFYIISLGVLLVGIYLKQLVFAVVPILILSFRKKELYGEMFIGFLFILVLANSLEPVLSWAKEVRIIYFVMMSLFLIAGVKNHKINKLYFLFLPFTAISFLSILNSDTMFTSMEKTISYFLLYLIVPNYFVIGFSQKGETFLKQVIYFIIIVLLSGFVLNFVLPEVTHSHGQRYRGMFGNPNEIGLFSFLSFMLTHVVYDLYPDLFSKKEKIMLQIVIISSIILSGARTAILALAVFLLFGYFYRKSPFLGFILFVVLLVSYDLLFALSLDLIIKLGLSEYFRMETLLAGAGRFVAWEFAWEHITKNIFFGKGFYYTEFLFRSNRQYLADLGHDGHAHNVFLTFWLETGLFGLLAFIIAFFSLFYKAAKVSRLAIPCMYATLFSATFESWLCSSLNPFTIIFLITMTIMTDLEIISRKTELKQ